MDANPSDALLRLVRVGWHGWVLGWIGLLKDKQTVVAEIFEVSAEKFEELFFLVLEEVLVLLNELSDNVIKQGEGIGQVHQIVVSLAASTDN